MLLEYFLQHCDFCSIRDSTEHLSDHHGLVGFANIFAAGWKQRGKSDAAAGVADQILETEALPICFVAQRADRQRGQRHKDAADAEAGDYIWQNNAAYRHLQAQLA